MSGRLLLDPTTVERCYRDAHADRWAVPRPAFAAMLAASVQRAFPEGTPSKRQVDAYLGGLHLEDLALACACAEGHDGAWDHFVLQYRPVLYRAADATGDSARGREVADSLYAELFGLRLRDGERHSHFRYFHGRSSLATWLRAVLAQRLIDAGRRSARLSPLPDDESNAVAAGGPAPRTAAALRYVEILQRVIATVVAALAPRDRLRLRCYYAQDLTLAQIGQLVGEHEATVSRNLARTRREVRQHVEAALREREGMSAAEINECFEAATEDPGPLDLAELLGADADSGVGRKEVVQNRSR
jgi:RNA polymerase sigma-70 factor, ECF subfamily